MTSGLRYSSSVPPIDVGAYTPSNFDMLSSYGAQPSYGGVTGAGIRSNTGQVSSLGQTGLGGPLGSNGAAAGGGGSMWDGMLGTSTQQGWGGMALGVANGAMNAWMGLKQYGLAKATLAEGKRQFGLNYDAQRRTTNASLEDRQRARVASNAGAYQSVGSYMSQNGIPGG